METSSNICQEWHHIDLALTREIHSCRGKSWVLSKPSFLWFSVSKSEMVSAFLKPSPYVLHSGPFFPWRLQHTSSVAEENEKSVSPNSWGSAERHQERGDRPGKKICNCPNGNWIFSSITSSFCSLWIPPTTESWWRSGGDGGWDKTEHLPGCASLSFNSPSQQWILQFSHLFSSVAVSVDALF